MQKIWLMFAQSVTIFLGLLFAWRAVNPEANQRSQSPIVINQAPSEKAHSSANLRGQDNSYRSAVSKAMPSVVNIFTTSKMNRPNPHEHYMDDPLFRHFFGERQEEPESAENSLGSGVIVSSNGLILTNNHVVAQATEIEIAFANGKKLSAEVVGADPDTDLALIKVDSQDLPAITFGDNNQLGVGDVVLAIGNPFGVGQTVTQGIVSALGRNHLGINTFENFIQTDASINPGNSGGALIDANGHLIGINSAIYSRNGGSMGIGFAIPVSIAKQVMEQIAVHGSVTRGWIGIEAQDITPGLAESFHIKTQSGALIAGVLRDSPADKAGLKAGDVLIGIDEKAVADSSSMLNIIAVLKPGQPAKLKIVRAGETIEIKVLVGKRPQPKVTTR